MGELWRAVANLDFAHVLKVVVRRVYERRLWLRYGWLLHDGWLLYDGCVGVSQIAQDVIHDRCPPPGATFIRLW